MTKGKGIGQALYIETRRKGYTNQYIFFPERYDTVARKYVPVTLLHRQTSVGKPKGTWRPRTDGTITDVRTLDPATGTIKRDLPKEVAAKAALLAYEQHKLHFEAVISQVFDIYKSPLVIEYTPTDLLDLNAGKTPEAFLRRVDAARIEAGYDKNLVSE